MYYDAITIDRQISDYDGTYFTLKWGFSNQKTFQRTIWDYKRGDYTLMRNKIIDANWESMINDELDVNNACSNFTDAFLTIVKECIPTREVTIRTEDKCGLIQVCAGNLEDEVGVEKCFKN
jgi:hypothetical protein